MKASDLAALLAQHPDAKVLVRFPDVITISIDSPPLAITSAEIVQPFLGEDRIELVLEQR